MESGYATLISFSSAGARSSHHHRTKQQFSFFIRFSISFLLNDISISTSTHSQVAAGVVIDLEKVLGILIPSDASKGIIIIVVSFHGTHHMQCLSATIHLNLSVSHVSAIALVIRKSSSSVDLLKNHNAEKYVIKVSVKRLVDISFIIAWISL